MMDHDMGWKVLEVFAEAAEGEYWNDENNEQRQGWLQPVPWPSEADLVEAEGLLWGVLEEQSGCIRKSIGSGCSMNAKIRNPGLIW